MLLASAGPAISLAYFCTSAHGKPPLLLLNVTPPAGEPAPVAVPLLSLSAATGAASSVSVSQLCPCWRKVLPGAISPGSQQKAGWLPLVLSPLLFLSTDHAFSLAYVPIPAHGEPYCFLVSQFICISSLPLLFSSLLIHPPSRAIILPKSGGGGVGHHISFPLPIPPPNHLLQ